MLTSLIDKNNPIIDQKLCFKIVDPKLYIEAVLPVLGLYASATGELKDAHDSPLEVLHSKIYRSYIIDKKYFMTFFKKEERPDTFTKDTLMAALGEVLFDERKKFVQSILDRVKFVEEDFTNLRRWVKAINEETTELDVLTVAHYLWGVKRKMLGLKSHYPLVLHLHGVQRTGKSTAIEALIEPLKPCVKNVSIETVTDPRASANILNKHFMVFIDEIEWPERGSVDTLKRLISSQEESYRIMRSNDTPTLKNNASFITAANRPIGDIIRDQTGMGRYFEIHVPKPTKWSEITGPNSIDFVKIYQGIDENLETGYWNQIKDYVQPLQEKMVATNVVGTFIEEYNLKITPEGTVAEVSAAILFEKFAEFLDKGKYRDMDRSFFGQKMTQAGFSSRKTTYKGKSITLYLVNGDTTIEKFGEVKPFKSEGKQMG